jgi:ubiquinone/menaquinone biosynthesis C-methylase UbiE
MSAHENEEYSDNLINFLEVVWGEGYLSPGGAEEVSRILEGSELQGRRVLDIGCGSGGIAMEMAEQYGAGEVVGIDVEASVLARAAERVADRGLKQRITLKQVEPGPLPFNDNELTSCSARTR